MKNKKLLPIALLAALMLSACAGSGSSESSQGGSSQGGSETSESSGSDTGTTEESSEDSSPSEGTEDTSEQVQYDVDLLNIETIGEDLRVGDHRDLDIELTPEANVQLEINKGNLVITSSAPEVVAITGAAISALAEGEATISLAYHDVTLDVVLTVLPKLTPKIKYGTVHEGTAEDPFDNEDAVKVGHYIKDNGGTTVETDLYIKGVVTSFYHAPGSRDDGACSFYLQPAEEGGEKFEVYKCYKEGEKEGATVALTTNDIWKGAEVLVHGPITFYNDGKQAETPYAWFDGVTGGDPKPADPVDISATFDEVMTVGQALADGDSTYDFYVFDAYVVKKSGTNYFVYKSDEAEGLDNKALIELYSIKSEEQQAQLLEGALVTIKMHVKNYHGQIENDGAVVITVKTEGKPWSSPEPAVAKKTLAEFIALDAADNGKHAYEVTAQVKSLDGKDGDGSQYGNITLTDGTNDLVIYGCSATATALVWDGSAAYAFTNPKDFLTNEVTSAIIVGDTLQMKLIRADYKGAVQGTGIVLEVNPDDPGEVDYGTVDNPLSVANLLEDNGTICPQEQGAFSAQKVVVLGKLTEAVYSEKYGTYTGYLADTNDETKTIKFTGVKLSEDVAKQVAANDVVILTHYLEYYNGGYALYYQKDDQGVYDYGDFLVRVQEGTSAVTVEAEHATVNGLAETYTNDETATFTVTVEEGYEVTGVKAYGQLLEADPNDGSYSFMVAGDVTVEVLTQESGAAVTSIEWTATAETTATIPSAYSADLQENPWTLAFGSENVTMNGANLKSGGTYIMLGSKAQSGVAFMFNTAAVSAPIKSIVIKTGSGASDSATYAVTFGTAALDTATSEAGTNVKKGTESYKKSNKTT